VNTSIQISVIVPVYNGGAQLEKCIQALLASSFHQYEVIVVDDASTDGAATACRLANVKVLRLASRSGPGAARNRGVEHAVGDVILFVDADVVVRRDTLASVAAFFTERSDVAAVFGSYDDEPEARNFVSQYKNLLHHFTHQHSATKAETFWAGCGAVRRDAFRSAGGFDEKRYPRPSIEDIELGYRLRRRGFSIALKKDLEVKHLKRWSIASLFRADVLDRAVPWSRLIMEDGEILNDLNLRVSERICASLVLLAVALLALAYLYPPLLLGVPIAALSLLFLKRNLFAFFVTKRGIPFGVASFAMLTAYYTYSSAVFASLYCTHLLRKFTSATELVQSGSSISRDHDV